MTDWTEDNVRVIVAREWFSATTPTLPMIVGYGRSAEEATARLRAELDALEVNLQDQLDRIRAVRAAWAQEGEHA
jgi:hypothetical protein